MLSVRRVSCSSAGVVNNLRGQVTNRSPRGFSRSFSARSKQMDDPVQQLMLYKRVSGATAVGVTLLWCYWLGKRKGDRMKALLKDCTLVNLEPGHYESNVSFYRYRGYVLPGQIVMSGVLQELPSFEFRDTDVVVASYPKTGTTWVQQIVYMLKNGCQATTGEDENLETRFPYLEFPYPGIRTVAGMPGDRCIKTHLPYSLLPPSIHDCAAKVVYVTRNPRDTAVSYYHFMRLLTTTGFVGTFSDFIDDFLRDEVPYSPFFSHVRSYYSERDNPAVLFLTYEEMQCDPTAAVRRIAHHLNVAVSDEDVLYVVAHTSFIAMSRNPSVNYDHWKQIGFAHTDRGNFLRKGIVGDWQSSLNAEQVTRFEAWENSSSGPGDCNFTYNLDTT